MPFTDVGEEEATLQCCGHLLTPLVWGCGVTSGAHHHDRWCASAVDDLGHRIHIDVRPDAAEEAARRLPKGEVGRSVLEALIDGAVLGNGGARRIVGAVDRREGLHAVGAEAAHRAIRVRVGEEGDQFAIPPGELIEPLDGVVPVIAVVEGEDDPSPGEGGVHRATVCELNGALINLLEERIH